MEFCHQSDVSALRIDLSNAAEYQAVNVLCGLPGASMQASDQLAYQFMRRQPGQPAIGARFTARRADSVVNERSHAVLIPQSTD